MASPSRIRVMISSRCNDPIEFDGAVVTLSDVRRRLKKELEKVKIFESQLFDVWINEDAPPAEGTEDAWEHCLSQVAAADIVLALYNGNSGWAKHGSEIGICHAELQKALSVAAAKTRLIELPLDPSGTVDATQAQRDDRFRRYVRSQSLFRGETAANGIEAIERVTQALGEAVPAMVRLGGREAQRGRYHSGDALTWSRLDFAQRRTAMRKTLIDALSGRTESDMRGDHPSVKLNGKQLVIACHAIPATMATAGALDGAHQPFLRDHEPANRPSDGHVGPVHMIACHRNVTETQAIRQLGFPDATVVTPPFGVYVADNVQKIQLVFISNCRDETSTRLGVQRFFEWLEQSDEGIRLAQRAEARARIVEAIAAEFDA